MRSSNRISQILFIVFSISVVCGAIDRSKAKECLENYVEVLHDVSSNLTEIETTVKDRLDLPYQEGKLKLDQSVAIVKNLVETKVEEFKKKECTPKQESWDKITDYFETNANHFLENVTQNIANKFDADVELINDANETVSKLNVKLDKCIIFQICADFIADECKSGKVNFEKLELSKNLESLVNDYVELARSELIKFVEDSKDLSLDIGQTTFKCLTTVSSKMVRDAIGEFNDTINGNISEAVNDMNIFFNDVTAYKDLIRNKLEDLNKTIEDFTKVLDQDKQSADKMITNKTLTCDDYATIFATDYEIFQNETSIIYENLQSMIQDKYKTEQKVFDTYAEEPTQLFNQWGRCDSIKDEDCLNELYAKSLILPIYITSVISDTKTDFVNFTTNLLRNASTYLNEVYSQSNSNVKETKYSVDICLYFYSKFSLMKAISTFKDTLIPECITMDKTNTKICTLINEDININKDKKKGDMDDFVAHIAKSDDCFFKTVDGIRNDFANQVTAVAKNVTLAIKGKQKEVMQTCTTSWEVLWDQVNSCGNYSNFTCLLECQSDAEKIFAEEPEIISNATKEFEDYSETLGNQTESNINLYYDVVAKEITNITKNDPCLSFANGLNQNPLVIVAVLVLLKMYRFLI